MQVTLGRDTLPLLFLIHTKFCQTCEPTPPPASTDKLPPKSDKRYTNADRNNGKSRTRTTTTTAEVKHSTVTPTGKSQSRTKPPSSAPDIKMTRATTTPPRTPRATETVRQVEINDGFDDDGDWLADEYADVADSVNVASNSKRDSDSNSRRTKDSAGGGEAARGKQAAQKKADDLYLKLINMGFTEEQARAAVAAASDVEEEASDVVEEGPSSETREDIGSGLNGTFELFEGVKSRIHLDVVHPPSSGLKGAALEHLVSQVMETALPNDQLDQRCKMYERDISSNPIEDILFEVQRSDEDLAAFLNERASGRAFKADHGHKRMDVLRTQCIVRLHPEVVDLSINVDRKQTTLLGLLLRLQFIRRLEAAEVVPFPNYWWLVREVIEQGGDPDIDLGSGVTALHVAARFRQHDLASLMIDSGAKPHARDYAGNTPLTYVLVTSNECIVMFSRCMIDDIPLGHKKHSMDGMFGEFCHWEPS